MKIIEDIERFVLAEIAVDLNKKLLAADEDLLEQGIVDSLGVIKLIIFLEETFGIKITDEDVVPENFQTLNDMARYVHQKMSATNAC